MQEPSLLWLPTGVVGNAAEETLEVAATAALFLDPWQQIGLEAICGERANGLWAAVQAAIIADRRNGKGGILEARELGGIMVLDDLEIRHTAHRTDTAKDACRKLWSRIKASPELFDRVGGDSGLKTAHEEMSITVRDTGARILYTTRSTGGARGLDGDLVVFDEALYLPPEFLADILPVILARPNPQVIYASTPGLATSVVLHNLRRHALLGDDPNFAYCEWGAERPRLVDGRVVSDPVDPDDRANYAAGNPALGYRLTIAKIETVKRGLAIVPGKFSRECLGVWDPLPAEQEAKPVKLPADAWARTGITTADALLRWPAVASAAFAVSRDGEWTSMATAAGSLTGPACYVEVFEHKQGVGWLPAAVVKLLQAHPDLIVGCNGAGFSGSQVGAVLAAMAEEGILAERLKVLGAADYKHACGAFYSDVTELLAVVDDEGEPVVGRDGTPLLRARLQRPATGQGPLDLAVEVATERGLSGGWAWDSPTATVPVSPLEAVTCARALLPAKVDNRSVYDKREMVVLG